MTDERAISDCRMNRRNFLVALTAEGALVALGDGRVLAGPGDGSWPEDVEQFPALACDGSSNIWMASLVRPMPDRHIRIDCLKAGGRKRACILEPPNMTGITAPAIAPLANGCIVAFGVEQDDRWRIAYAFVHETAQRDAVCRYIQCEGSSNISPAVGVVGNLAHVVWESNGGQFRGIYACHIDQRSVGPVQRLSSPQANSYNPSIVALADGSMFAAWDSIRRHRANIYGARFLRGQWQSEKRVTDGRRIERHPFVTSWNNEIWIAWQAQSYKGRHLNNLTEQRIAVGRLTGDGLEAPLDLFTKVSTPQRLLMRPRIAFDPDGRMWLTASLGMKKLQAGWRPVVWQYSDGQWSEMQSLSSEQSRWQPIPIVFAADSGASFAVQSDDLPQGWDRTRGKFRDWRSKVTVRRRRMGSAADLDEIQTRLLKMPDTDFSLAERIGLASAKLPRQKWKRRGRELTLFWGDFHDHTDLSVCNRRHNPPGHDLFANLRDIERLDFCALTDHGYNFDPQQWSLNGEQTRYDHDPHRFVTFLGQEWTSSTNYTSGGYGHRNLVFLDPYYDRFHDSFDAKISPGNLWEELKGIEFICIPHQLADWQHKGRGNPPTDWSFVDERLQPVAEIFQTRESYEYLGCPRQA
ncbi:MAG: CehA/McbA family metallohydrolase domain-containing protein, partial [Planctomycetota bacterium]